LKPSNGKRDSQMLNVPSFSSRSLSDSPVLSSADEDDVFLCVPSCAGRRRPAGKDSTAELLSKSAPTSAYMEAARRSDAAEQWQPPFPTFFGEAEASGGEIGFFGKRSSSLPQCSGPTDNHGLGGVGARPWFPPPPIVVGAERHCATPWPSAGGRERTTSISSVTSLIIDMENSSVTRGVDSTLDTSTSLVEYLWDQDQKDA
ncbi:unnamed protein product, partial [Ixodes pacificus]